ncbi:MAG TPA: hypothetical protein VMF90_14235 [Rhizobiaceae bacterium]|nr:hypothetical protein [Rhizobiaceae bacterium]
MTRLALLIATLVVAAPAAAETSGWLTDNQFRKYSREQSRAGKLMTKLDCKNGSNYDDPQNGAVLFRATFVPNTKKSEWRYIWGELGAYKRNTAKLGAGFRRASYASFTRQSGLFIQCSLWIKSN